MDYRFDRLARAAGAAMTRREAVWRVGGGLLAGVLSSFGVASAAPGNQPCGQCCAFACANLDEPPRGREMGECIRRCLETGEAVGPTGETSDTCKALGVCP